MIYVKWIGVNIIKFRTYKVNIDCSIIIASCDFSIYNAREDPKILGSRRDAEAAESK